MRRHTGLLQFSHTGSPHNTEVSCFFQQDIVDLTQAYTLVCPSVWLATRLLPSPQRSPRSSKWHVFHCSGRWDLAHSWLQSRHPTRTPACRWERNQSTTERRPPKQLHGFEPLQPAVSSFRIILLNVDNKSQHTVRGASASGEMCCPHSNLSCLYFCAGSPAPKAFCDGLLPMWPSIASFSCDDGAALSFLFCRLGEWR